MSKNTKKISPAGLSIAQKIGWLALRPILKLFTGCRLITRCDISDLKRPLLVVANHQTFLDPPLIGTVLPFNCPVYPIYFITKDSIMAAPFVGGFLKLCGAFAARRGEGLEKAIEEPRQILKSGYSVVFFPQGKRYPEFKIEQGRPGASLLALETNVNILPVAILGLADFSWKKFFLRRHKVKIIVGQPFALKEKLDQFYASGSIEIGVRIIMQEIKKLME
jgi:1-acyl-sn-glycerol-3-phosphate acyltransferase